MPPFTIYSILGGISLGLSTTEILGSVRSRNGKQQWPDENLPRYIYPMKLTCQYHPSGSVGAVDVRVDFVERNRTPISLDDAAMITPQQPRFGNAA